MYVKFLYLIKMELKQKKFQLNCHKILKNCYKNIAFQIVVTHETNEKYPMKM